MPPGAPEAWEAGLREGGERAEVRGVEPGGGVGAEDARAEGEIEDQGGEEEDVLEGGVG